MTAAVLPAVGQSDPPPAGEGAGFSFQGEGEERVENLDAREGQLQPTEAQQAAAASLGAKATRWNRFGTPQVLFNRKGYLSGARAGDTVDVARNFVLDQRAVFGMTPEAVADLEVVSDAPLLDGPDQARAHVTASRSPTPTSPTSSPSARCSATSRPAGTDC